MTQKKGVSFHMPATYQIQVQGFLDENWSDRLGGMTVTATQDADDAPITTLSGRLQDQAALLGVLNTLYDLLRLPLLSVGYLGDQKQTDKEI